MWRRLWCALRGHPYPRTFTNVQAYDDWLAGRLKDPSSIVRCMNCNTEIQRRG